MDPPVQVASPRWRFSLKSGQKFDCWPLDSTAKSARAPPLAPIQPGMGVGASGQAGGVGLVAGKLRVVSGCVGGLVVGGGVGRRGRAGWWAVSVLWHWAGLPLGLR